MKGNGQGNVLLSDVIDWGQGVDEDIMEVLRFFKQFHDAYYELINYGDWWDVFNQGVVFDETMKKEWEKIESIDFMSRLDTMAMAIVGNYVRFDKFAEGCFDAYEKGNGLRHKPEDKEN